MSKQIFVNLPVKDLNRSREFFGKLGFTFNEQFSDENATSLVIDDDNGIYAMLLVESFYKTFTNKELADRTTHTSGLVALGVESREEVDRVAEAALAGGGKTVKEPMDEGFMYGRSFEDLDGHHWEVMWMDPATVEGQG